MKPRSTHRADAPRLVELYDRIGAPCWWFPHVVPPGTIGLNLDIENALVDGPEALCDFSTLDVENESTIMVLGYDQPEGHYCSICHPDHKLA
eukprot:6011738-Pleurochrysis_carterae.AAC.1